MALSSRIRFCVLRRDGFRCGYCGRGIEDGVKLHVDHIQPRSAGGRDTFSNLVTACQDCNLGKATRTVGDWTPFVATECYGCGEELILTRQQYPHVFTHDRPECNGSVCYMCGAELEPDTWLCPPCAAEQEATDPGCRAVAKYLEAGA